MAEELHQDPDVVRALPRGSRVADSSGDLWQKQGGTDSWKLVGPVGIRTTSERLLDLWGPLALVPENGLTGNSLQ